MNEHMADELKKFVPKAGMEETYKEVALDVYKKFNGATHTGRKEIVAEIESLNTKISKARNIVFGDKLDTDDFRKIKRECEDKIKRLEFHWQRQREDQSVMLWTKHIFSSSDT